MLLSSAEISLILLVGIALYLIISNRLRPDLVAMMVLLAMGLGHFVTSTEALAGFSSPAILTIAGLFVIGAALEKTGAIQWLADRLAEMSGGGEKGVVLVFMLAGATLSLIMNNIAAGAVLMPAALQVSRRVNVAPSRVLMPLSFGTLLGGMATYFTTANVILSGTLVTRGLKSLNMLDFLPTGGLVLIAGSLYMVFIGRKMLPKRGSALSESVTLPDLADTYQLMERLWEVRILPNTPLAGMRLLDAPFGAQLGLTVLAIWRNKEAIIPPAPQGELYPGDILLVLGREDRVRKLSEFQVQIGRRDPLHSDMPNLPVRLSEVLIAPRSPAIGHTLKSLRFRNKYGLTTVALWREGRSYRTDVGEFTIQAGDALLMVGQPIQIHNLAVEPGYLVLDPGEEQVKEITSKAPVAALITLTALFCSIFGLLPTAEAVLAAGALLVASGCLNMEDAYEAIEWRVITLIAGMLPIGSAMLETGLAAHIGQLFTSFASATGPLGFIATLFLFTVLVTQFVGGQVAALIMGPIAVGAAIGLQINPHAVAVAVAIACSTAFITPISHPVNVIMMGPGGYSFKDFARIGIGLTLVCFAALMLGIFLFWKL